MIKNSKCHIDKWYVVTEPDETLSIYKKNFEKSLKKKKIKKMKSDYYKPIDYQITMQEFLKNMIKNNKNNNKEN